MLGGDGDLNWKMLVWCVFVITTITRSDDHVHYIFEVNRKGILIQFQF